MAEKWIEEAAAEIGRSLQGSDSVGVSFAAIIQRHYEASHQVCHDCDGKGRVMKYGPKTAYFGECKACNGKGRIVP